MSELKDMLEQSLKIHTSNIYRTQGIDEVEEKAKLDIKIKCIIDYIGKMESEIKNIILQLDEIRNEIRGSAQTSRSIRKITK
jgi:uncharacterized protein (UPF0335 family)